MTPPVEGNTPDDVHHRSADEAVKRPCLRPPERKTVTSIGAYITV
jgi:hypothetical protein